MLSTRLIVSIISVAFCFSKGIAQEKRNYTTENKNGITLVHNHSENWKNPLVQLEFSQKIGSLTTDEIAYQLFNPTDVALDSKGNIYIVDNNRLQKFSPEGDFIKQIGNKGEGPGEYLSPLHVEIGRKDNLFLISKNKKKVHIFDLDGNFIRFFNVKVSAIDYALLKSGEMLFHRFFEAGKVSSNALVKLDENGEKITDFVAMRDYQSGWQWNTNGNTLFVTSDKDDNIYVSFKFQNRIEKYDVDGNLALKIDRKKPYSESKKKIQKTIVKNNGKKDFFDIVNIYSWGIEIDSKDRIWILSHKRQYTEEEFANDDFKDVFNFELYSPEGILLGTIDITNYSPWGTFRVFGDRLFIVDRSLEMAVYEYKIIGD